MNRVTVVAQVQAKPGRKGSWSGPCERRLRYLTSSLVDPSLLIMLEHWTSKEAVNQHFPTAHVQVLTETRS